MREILPAGKKNPNSNRELVRLRKLQLLHLAVSIDGGWGQK